MGTINYSLASISAALEAYKQSQASEQYNTNQTKIAKERAKQMQLDVKEQKRHQKVLEKEAKVRIKQAEMEHEALSRKRKAEALKEKKLKELYKTAEKILKKRKPTDADMRKYQTVIQMIQVLNGTSESDPEELKKNFARAGLKDAWNAFNKYGQQYRNAVADKLQGVDEFIPSETAKNLRAEGRRASWNQYLDMVHAADESGSKRRLEKLRNRRTEIVNGLYNTATARSKFVSEVMKEASADNALGIMFNKLNDESKGKVDAYISQGVEDFMNNPEAMANLSKKFGKLFPKDPEKQRKVLQVLVGAKLSSTDGTKRAVILNEAKNFDPAAGVQNATLLKDTLNKLGEASKVKENILGFCANHKAGVAAAIVAVLASLVFGGYKLVGKIKGAKKAKQEQHAAESQTQVSPDTAALESMLGDKYIPNM